MKYKMSDESLDHVFRVSLDGSLNGEGKRGAISKIISSEWEKIFTIHPKASFLVGIGMIFFIFLIEIFAAGGMNIDQPENYKFILLLSGSLAAAAFSAGFTGSMNINIKWLQSSGALAIFSLVFLSSPFSVSKKEETDQKKASLTSFFVSSAYADPVEDEIKENTGDKVNYTRIYYSAGVSDLKDLAFRVKNSMAGISKSSDVYSLGSVVSGLVNNLKYDDEQYFVNIRYRPSLESDKIDAVLKTLKSMGVVVEKDYVSQSYSEADITIYILTSKKPTGKK
ncbi:MAG: hypothetical protein L3J88_03090 [Gammaproteobacteria bacterium]|nr:hypothetical protein [Gammaproteobacteria bacterium]